MLEANFYHSHYRSIGSNCTGISMSVTELIDLQQITEGHMQVVVRPDIFGHAPVRRKSYITCCVQVVDTHNMLCNQEYITLEQECTTPRIGSRNKIKIGGGGLPRNQK